MKQITIIIFIAFLFPFFIYCQSKNSEYFNTKLNYDTANFQVAYNYLNFALKKYNSHQEEFYELQSIKADILFNIGKIDSAEIVYLKTNSLLKTKKNYKKNPIYYKNLREYSDYLRNISKFDKSDSLIQICLNFKQKENDKIEELEYSKTIQSYANLLFATENYKTAKNLFEKSINLRLKHSDTTSNDYAILLSDYATVLLKFENYHLAQIYYNKALKITKNNHSVFNYYRILYEYCLFFYVQENFNEAQKLLFEISDFVNDKLGQNNLFYADILYIMFGITTSLDNYETNYYTEANNIIKNILGENNTYYLNLNIDYGIVLSGIAYSYLNDDKIDEFEIYRTKSDSVFEICYKIVNNIANNDSFLETKANLYNSLANSSVQKGEFEKANNYFDSAMFYVEKSLGNNSLKYIYILNNKAQIYFYTRNLPKAEEYILEAFTVFNENYGKNNFYYYSILNNLSALLKFQKKYDEAFKYQKLIFDYEMEQIVSNIKFYTTDESIYFFKRFSGNMDLFYNYQLKINNSDISITDLIYNKLLIFKDFSLNNTINYKELFENSNDTVIKKYYIQLNEINSELGELYATNKSNQWKNVDSLEIQADNIEKKLIFRAKELQIPEFYNSVVIDTSIKWTDIKNSLKENEAAIEFFNFQVYSDASLSWIDSTIYCALIITKNTEKPQMIELFEEKQLLKILNSNEFFTDKEKITKIYQQKGDSLYILIWQPIEKYLAGVNKVYISPSGFLNNISFEAIKTPRDNMLIDNYNICYLNSTKQILNTEPLFVDNLKSAALIGGVNYSAKNPIDYNIRDSLDCSKSIEKYFYKLTYLPGSKKEIDSIEKVISQKNIKTIKLQDSTASEKSFYNLQNENVEILHISTHGFYFSEKEAKEIPYFKNKNIEVSLFRTGLFLAGSQNTLNDTIESNSINDGILNGYEISKLYFKDLKLVVLSSCQSGIGDLNSDGVYSLKRSFKMAGADYIIISLWKISDEVSNSFFCSFYNYLSKGFNIEEAFIKSKLDLKNSDKYSNPYYWAGFILTL